MRKKRGNVPYLSIVAPAYNEEVIIAETIEGWESYIRKEKLDAEVVICNDGSVDKTGEILAKLQKKYPNLIICENKPNKGYGMAICNAIKHAKGKLIMTIDSDGQFNVNSYKKLHRKLISGNYDLVTGYRYRKKDNLMRIIADRCFSLIMRTTFGLKFKDTNCAQKLYYAKVIKNIPIEACGYPVPTEIMVKAAGLGAKIGEVGVVHNERKKGASKLKLFKTSINVLKFLFYLRFKLHAYKRKIIHSL